MAPKLPILPLPYPLVVLPGARVTLTVDDALGRNLADLVEESESPPTVAAVPIVNATSTEGEEPVFSEWGCASRVLRVTPPSLANRAEKHVISLRAMTRVQLTRSLKLSPGDTPGLIRHPIRYPPPETTPKRELVSKFKTASLKMLDQLIENSGRNSRRGVLVRFASMVENMSDGKIPGLADVLVWGVMTDHTDRLDYLSAHSTDDRLQRAINMFVKYTSISEVSKKIASTVDESLSKQQKEFFLRQQLLAIQQELASLHRDGSESGPGSSTSQSELDNGESTTDEDMAEIKRKIEAMVPGSEERKMGVREWRRLRRIPPQSTEHGVISNYLEWLTSLPWPTQHSVDSTNAAVLKERTYLAKARQQLDADHYGLEKVKRRLIEYLAVLRLRQSRSESEVSGSKATVQEPSVEDIEELVGISKKAREMKGKGFEEGGPASSSFKASGSNEATKSPILLFVGPPGTGKTSLGKSIARTLDRPFERISLGGVRDEAEIRGHRRTYVASGPGIIVQALRKAGRPDPVIVLDEVDKVAPMNYHGDVSSALLEVLDPEQNHSFHDHYLNVPLDLSQVLFICTANALTTISAPLLDRCEVIHLSGYTYDEKVHIARRFLIPTQLRANALDESQLSLSDDALRALATRYTSEAGVRSLERAVGAVARFKAVKWSEAIDMGKQTEYSSIVEEKDLEVILGVAHDEHDEKEREPRHGVVNALVVLPQGEGALLLVESSVVPGTGKLKLTGSLGEVIRESSELALSWVKSHAYSLRITNSPSQNPLKVPNSIDIHLHLPAGAVKKDGPSAGVAMVCAFVSLLTGAIVPTDIAMTGEMTLSGRVTAIGGVKEKVLGAHRANMRKVILPYTNRKDVEQDVPLEVRKSMEFVFVRTVEEALDTAFGKGTFLYRPELKLAESRL